MKTSLSIALFLAAAPILACSKTGGQPGGATSDGGSTTGSGLSLALLNGFEGEIDGVIEESKAGSQATTVTALVRNGKVRFDVPEVLAKTSGSPMGEKAYAIFDSGQKKLLVVSDAQRQAMVFDLNNGTKPFHRSGPGVQGSAPQSPPSKIVKTGKTDAVAGYKCENWDVVSDHKEGTVCVADQGASWFSLPATGIPADQSWAAELVDGKHFPLRLVHYEKDGTTEESRIEVTKIEKKSLNDAQFEVPAGYRTIDLEKMLQGMSLPGTVPSALPGGHPPPRSIPR